MSKEELIAVYKDTKEICSGLVIPQSEKFNAVYSSLSFSQGKGEIIIEPLDTVSALEKYAPSGKTAVLNMASSKRKGGGVEKGAMAQEECLFRCSNLFTISDEFYPLSVDDFIYTHQAAFVKNVKYEKITPVYADVITIAALNMNTSNKYYDENEANGGYEFVMKNKIHKMLDSAMSNGCTNIILGAWGCGVFKNDPATVARLFKSVLEQKRYCFENVIFAVINDRNSVGNNYKIFSEAFKNESINH